MKKFKELKEKAKETKKKISESVKELQESLGEKEEKQELIIESDIEEQYSDEDKQRELANLSKAVVKAENIVKDWENKKSEAPNLIEKLTDYRDNKKVV